MTSKAYRFKTHRDNHAYTEDPWTTLGHHWLVIHHSEGLVIYFIKQDFPGKSKEFPFTVENLPRAIKAQLFLLGVNLE